MGFIYKVEYYTSNDVLLCSGHIGLAVTPSPSTSVRDVQNNYNYFVDECASPGESIYLGAPYFGHSNLSDYSNIGNASLWLPACSYQGVNDSAFDANGLTDVKIKFVDNGYYMTQTGGRLKGYDNNDVEIFNYPLPSATEPVWGSCVRDLGGGNQRMIVNVLTVREINPDGTIPTTATCWVAGIAIYKQNILEPLVPARVTGQFVSWGAIGGIADFFNATPHYGLGDPYEPGGDTGDDDTPGEGGTGDFDGSTDPIDFPDLPTVSAVDTKFLTIFNPSKAQLTSLAEYMWSPLFDLDTLKKLWADPMDCILGLTMVPFSVPNGGTGTVSIGNVSTGISMTKAGSQYVAIDCGSINVKEFWGGYLDYDPYTKFQIYLPYVGIKPLLADEIMGKSIHVKYHCDILTGACNCFVKCGGSVLYSFNGQCSTQIPISGNDWRNTISAAINIAGQAAGMYVTGGSTAPMAIASIAQSAVNGLKQSVEKSGSLSGTGGMLAIQKPYLIATRPKQAVAKNQNRFTGYPAFITRTLSSCSGYTEVYSCHLENIPCTSDELNEIENLLKAGVIL